MKTAGTFSAIGGLCCLAYAGFMDTDVPSDSILAGGSVLNLGLLQNQMMAWQLGLALLIIGAVLYAGGSLQERGEAAEVEAEVTSIDHAKADKTLYWILFGVVVLAAASFAVVAYSVP